MRTRWFPLTALALASCSGSGHKQIELSIDSNAAAPCDVDRIVIVANPDVSTRQTAIARDLGSSSFPISLTLDDETSSDPSFVLEVRLLKGRQEVRRARPQNPLRFDTDSQGTNYMFVDIDDKSCAGTPHCTASLDKEPQPVDRSQCVSHYSSSPGGGTFVSACETSHSTALEGGKHAEELDLPELAGSGLRFYGRLVRHVWAHKNGFLSFGLTDSDVIEAAYPGPFDRALNELGAPPPVLSAMPFWDELTLPDTGICYSLVNGKLSVTWAEACVTLPCKDSAGKDTSDLNFTFEINQGGVVTFAYGDMTPTSADRVEAADATIGLVLDAAQGCDSGACIAETGLCRGSDTPCGYSQVLSSTVTDLSHSSFSFTPSKPE